MSSREPTWRLVLTAATRLGGGGRTFTRDALIRDVQRTDPTRADSSIGPVIQGMTGNATGGPPSPCGTPLWRVDRGVYRLAETNHGPSTDAPQAAATPTTQTHGDTGDVVLVGCVKTKLTHAAAARDLYTSPLFRRRRAYAEASGVPWFIVSSRWGLVAPDEQIAPYDSYLPDRSPAYRRAWGSFVVAQLIEAVGPLTGCDVEVHAGADYQRPLTAPCEAAGARLLSPVDAHSLGETLAWYDHHLPTDTHGTGREAQAFAESAPASRSVRSGLVEHYARLLVDPAGRLTPAQLLALPPGSLAGPGLYSWWVNQTGAAHLSMGAGVAVAPGLIYAGLAGATRWPSGRRSTNTLWKRLTGMHLNGSAELSTFRRTLAALLREPLALTSEDDPALSQWMLAHLTVTPVPCEDADTLGQLEEALLGRLDPPLNLRGMPPSEVRTRLSRLRRANLP